MRSDDNRKQKGPQTKQGLKRTLEGIIERLREGLDELAEVLERGLRPSEPQPIPIPVPTRRPRSRPRY